MSLKSHPHTSDTTDNCEAFEKDYEGWQASVTLVIKPLVRKSSPQHSKRASLRYIEKTRKRPASGICHREPSWQGLAGHQVSKGDDDSLEESGEPVVRGTRESSQTMQQQKPFSQQQLWRLPH